MNIFHMSDILSLLDLPAPPPNRRDYDIPCPCCDKGMEKHLNINLVKDVFNCPRCNFNGGIFDLYAYYANIPRKSVYRELTKRLGDGAEQLSLIKKPNKSRHALLRKPNPHQLNLGTVPSGRCLISFHWLRIMRKIY